jgi:hypothetical protein
MPASMLATSSAFEMVVRREDRISVLIQIKVFLELGGTPPFDRRFADLSYGVFGGFPIAEKPGHCLQTGPA